MAMAAALVAGCGGDGGGRTGPEESTGCAGGTLQSGDQTVTLQHGGLTREYLLHVPDAYDGAEPWPLVLNFHGFTSDATQQVAFSDMSATADAEGFLVAYPQGVLPPEGGPRSWNGGTCCGHAASEGIDDVGFARAVVDDVAADGCVDLRRVFATGMSNGGYLSHRLACEASDVFAAAGPVAGVLGIPAEECTPERPVPLVHLHGTEDTLVPYEGGGAGGGESVPDMMQGWADRNGCAAEPSESFQNGDAHCDTWSGCDDGVEVTLCTIEGMGHCWPGSELGVSICPSLGFGEGSLDISANDRMWELFAQFPMP